MRRGYLCVATEIEASDKHQITMRYSPCPILLCRRPSGFRALPSSNFSAVSSAVGCNGVLVTMETPSFTSKILFPKIVIPWLRCLTH